MPKQSAAKQLPESTPCTGARHEGHEHLHGPNCGHDSYQHDGHTCYEHDGHFHRIHEDHVDECRGPKLRVLKK